MKFRELAIGQMFKFHAAGALLTKSGMWDYDAPQWDQRGLTVSDLDQGVLPESPQMLGAVQEQAPWPWPKSPEV